ncbi:MAG: endonuclease/exonuclease/phosphatase family protein [Treponematales bacterium]
MKIVSWNCHYGMTKENIEAVMRLDADILILQECRKEDYDVLKQTWRYKNWYGDDQEYSDLGIAVFSQDFCLRFTEDFNRNFRYVVPFECKRDDSFAFTLFVVWTKNYIKGVEGTYEYQENVFKALDWYRDKITGDRLVLGDFNTGRNDREQNERSYTDLKSKLEEHGLIDCYGGKEPTFFWYFDMNKPYQNDYCFASRNFKDKHGINVTIADKREWINPYLSDHCPIIVELHD